jgi:ABC-2 type transport system ATP-binding protein
MTPDNGSATTYEAAPLRASALCKTYDDGTVALKDVSLAVRTGEIYCLLGPNGSGKSTLINLFLDLIRPDSGAAYVMGVEVATDPLKVKRRLAYVSETVALYDNLSAYENLRFLTGLVGGEQLSAELAREALASVGLGAERLGQRVREFSKGMRQRLGLAAANLRDVPAVLLDEPTAGLDPTAADAFGEVLLGMRAKGKAVLLSSHDLLRISDVADRVGILRRGVKVAEEVAGSLQAEDLRALYARSMEPQPMNHAD